MNYDEQQICAALKIGKDAFGQIVSDRLARHAFI